MSRRGDSLCTMTNAASAGTATGRVSSVSKSMCSAWPSLAPAMASGSSSPTCAPAHPLGLLAGAGEGERVGVVAEREQDGHRERGARGQTGADGERAGDAHRATRGGRVEPEESGRQEGLVGNRRGAAQGNLEGLTGELVRVEADEEAARFRGEGDLGGEADGHGKGEAAVVVGVVADDGDASGGAGSGHDPQLVAGRTGLTATVGSGQHPAMAERSGPLSGIKIIELAGIGPAPFTCMMLADAGAEVLRLERAAPGCGRARRRGARRRARRRTGTS